MHATITESKDDGSTSNEAAGPDAPAPEFTPAVTARKSLSSKDHIISMIDGKPYKTLRRHLSTNRLKPEQYRERYNLKPDYPIVAETYSQQRREMAMKISLGQKCRQVKAAAPHRLLQQRNRSARQAPPRQADPMRRALRYCQILRCNESLTL
jgi:predicted transcriptional regulator